MKGRAGGRRSAEFKGLIGKAQALKQAPRPLANYAFSTMTELRLGGAWI
jgi:hypothetical protein